MTALARQEASCTTLQFVQENFLLVRRGLWLQFCAAEQLQSAAGRRAAGFFCPAAALQQLLQLQAETAVLLLIVTTVDGEAVFSLPSRVTEICRLVSCRPVARKFICQTNAGHQSSVFPRPCALDQEGINKREGLEFLA